MIINGPVLVHFYFKPNGPSFIFHFGLERLLPGQNIEIFWSALFFGVLEGGIWWSWCRTKCAWVGEVGAGGGVFVK